jgi:hypothetical protein
MAMGKINKASWILDLYDGKRTTREIADMVGCSDAYVRVVARQRGPSGISDIDRRYVSSNLKRIKDWQVKYQRNRYRTDPEFRERKLESARNCYLKRRAAEAASHG